MGSKHFSKEAVERHCKNWQSSGLKQSEYCRHTGLNPKSFARWTKQYKSKQLNLLPIRVEKESSAPEPEAMVASTEKLAEGSPSFEVEINLPNGISIRLSGCADPTPIIEVLRGVWLCR